MLGKRSHSNVIQDSMRTVIENSLSKARLDVDSPTLDSSPVVLVISAALPVEIPRDAPDRHAAGSGAV